MVGNVIHELEFPREMTMNYSVKERIMVSVLFVCLGNICRSPMAEAVFAT